MQVSTETEVTLRVEITLEKRSEAVQYRDGYSNYLAWKVEVIFTGSSFAEAVADPRPTVNVKEGYRIKLDGFRGARASRFHSLGWHNTEQTDYDRLVKAARIAAA